MNKKLILMIILSIILLAACKSKPVEADKNPEVNNPIENATTPEKDDAADKEIDKDNHSEAGKDEEAEEEKEEEDEKLVTHENNPLLKDALAGKLDTVEFPIGTATEEITNAWGIDNNYDYFMGGLYFIYEEKGVVFFTSAYDVGDEIQHGEVVAIEVFGDGAKAFGIEIGKTFNEIRAKLGESTYLLTPEENEANEFFHGSWVLRYQVGNYNISFVAEEETGIISRIHFR